MRKDYFSRGQVATLLSLQGWPHAFTQDLSMVGSPLLALPPLPLAPACYGLDFLRNSMLQEVSATKLTHKTVLLCHWTKKTSVLQFDGFQTVLIALLFYTMIALGFEYHVVHHWKQCKVVVLMVSCYTDVTSLHEWRPSQYQSHEAAGSLHRQHTNHLAGILMIQ
jgi:hypothetical protein